MNVRVARPDRPKIVPAFVVQTVDQEVERTMYGWDKQGKKTQRTVKEPYGFKVSFPVKGHSIRVRTVEDLRRLGFDQTIPLVDTRNDDDEPVGYLDNHILEKA